MNHSCRVVQWKNHIIVVLYLIKPMPFCCRLPKDIGFFCISFPIQKRVPVNSGQDYLFVSLKAPFISSPYYSSQPLILFSMFSFHISLYFFVPVGSSKRTVSSFTIKRLSQSVSYSYTSLPGINAACKLYINFFVIPFLPCILQRQPVINVWSLLVIV